MSSRSHCLDIVTDVVINERTLDADGQPIITKTGQDFLDLPLLSACEYGVESNVVPA